MFRSLGHRNFKLFFVGQFVSLTGSWMQQVALSWLVYRLTHDPYQLGLAGFVGQLPVFFLGLYAGVIVDRVDRRRLVLCTQSLALVQAAVLAALTLAGRVRLWEVYALAALAGTINAFDLPARQVLIGELVGPEERHNAIALNSTIVNGSRIIGPAAAGVLVHLWGEGVCFLLNAVSFLAVLAGLAAMQDVPRNPRPATDSAWTEIRGGIDYAFGMAPIRILLLLLAMVSAAGMPFVVLMPIFADKILDAGSRGMGLLMGASGVGATLGSLFLADRRGTAGLDRLVVRSTLVFGLALIAFSFSRSLALSCLFMAVIGLGVMVQMAGVNTLLQELSADRFRGRVMSLYSMMFMGIVPFGSFASGALAARIGAPWTVAIGASICIAAALQYVRALPDLVSRHRLSPRPLDLNSPGP